MRSYARVFSLLVLSAVWLVSHSAAVAQDRKPEEILQELNGVEVPKLTPDLKRDRAAAVQFLQKRHRALARRSSLIRALYLADLDHPKLPELIQERWSTLLDSGEPTAAIEVADETEEVLKRSRSKPLVTEALFARTILVLQHSEEGNDSEAVKLTDMFIKLAPKDDRGARLLYVLGVGAEKSREKQLAFYRRVVRDYPNSKWAAQAGGDLRKLEGIGKPFELEFTDAISGRKIEMKNYKGKIVVVDFWATWCDSCVVEMPRMKELYARYKDHGVEFLGVNLDKPKDEGGLDRMKAYVEENRIPWPQYYQGNYWDSEFSASWGVSALPAMFVVDRDGKLYSTDAQEKLEAVLNELLKKGR
jgi:thiol-disulfide isomerase/thioredoxin